MDKTYILVEIGNDTIYLFDRKFHIRNNTLHIIYIIDAR
jgi:hypothetical protein